MSNQSLITEVDAALVEQATREKERRASERNQQMERVRQAIQYTFDQEPDRVSWGGQQIGAVAVVDGLVMALSYRTGGVPSLSIVCVCELCNQKFLSAEHFGSDKNHYGASTETPQPFRRQRAVKEIAKVVARDFQPNGWGHDHKCAATVTRTIPVSLLPQVDALLGQETNG